MTITIIAEFGSSPMPAWDMALWCMEARIAGADAAKVQLFYVDVLYPEGQRAAMRGRDFPRERLSDFVEAAHRAGLEAGASVFDRPAVELAARHCDWLKLAGSQQGNVALAVDVACSGKPYYRSLTSHALLNQTTYHASNETRFFVVPEYPAPMVKTCYHLLRAARVFRAAGLRWGHSSHTTGVFDCALAAALGAVVVEKHFALSPSDCEAPHSLLPDQFAAMCRAIRKHERN